MAKSEKHIYLFGNKQADGNGSLKPLLGGKGANLAEMSRIGLPVPPGFTITTEVCTYFYDNKKTYPKTLERTVKAGVASVEKIMGTKFGDKSAMPLLVSVRSGAYDGQFQAVASAARATHRAQRMAGQHIPSCVSPTGR